MTDARTKRLASQKKYRDANPEKTREYKRKWQYGLSVEDFNTLLASQDGKCAICLTDAPGGRYNVWCVDHDHACCSGYRSCGDCVRGLLCKSCNWALGNLNDNLESAQRLVSYLERD